VTPSTLDARLFAQGNPEMPIGNRSLKILDPDGNIEVEVRLFMPEKDDQAWICRYEIDWPTRVKRSFAAGVDGIQAILLALHKIGISLYASEYHKNGKLIWQDPGHGCGFPISNNVRDLLIGDNMDL
jgi:hypothetical protein